MKRYWIILMALSRPSSSLRNFESVVITGGLSFSCFVFVSIGTMSNGGGDAVGVGRNWVSILTVIRAKDEINGERKGVSILYIKSPLDLSFICRRSRGSKMIEQLEY